MPANMQTSLRVLLLLLVVALGCNGTAHKRVGTSVTRGVERELGTNANEIDVARIADDFQWDSLFVFNPYAPRDHICSTIRVPEQQCSAVGIRDVDEGEFALVFMESGAVARVEYFPRRIGDFDESDRCLAKPIAKRAAKFAVQRQERVRLVCR
jgi:hypothetical protein